MMAKGKLTSVELTQAYLDRIAALNKRGPGLNAVTQLNSDALKQAALADRQRAMGHVLGPAHGLPILLKDLVDVTGMYTSAGNYSLRKSYPATDAGITKKLRERGVVILGKLGLSEFANSFGSQPSGFSNLTGQVINGIDADQNPSGSSSGTGTAMAAALSTLGIGTETSGSIISPSNAQSLVGLRPTVGLVPGYGIAPISASQDTAGPMVRNVSDAAMTLASIAGPDPDGRRGVQRDLRTRLPRHRRHSRRCPRELPDYMKALDVNFVKGKKIGYNGTLTDGSPLKIAYDALTAAGAIMVPRPTVDRRHAAEPAQRIRAAQDHRRVLQAARPAGADPVAGPGSGRQPGQRPASPEIRQQQPPQRVGRRHHPRRGQRDRVPDEPAHPQGRLAQGHRRHGDLHQLRPGPARRPRDRDPRQRSERAAGRISHDHDPHGIRRHDPPRGQRAGPRQRLQRVQPDRRRVRHRAGHPPAPDGRFGEPEHVPLREDGPGGALRRARALQPRLRHDHAHARPRRPGRCRSRWRRSRRRASAPGSPPAG